MEPGTDYPNPVIQTLLSHRTYRKYDPDREVPEEMVELIIRSAQAAASWTNSQPVTIIRVSDPERKKIFAELSGNQRHIVEAPVFFVFCADFNRIKYACELEGKEFGAAQNVDLLLVGATDVGIALGNAIAAAESLGLGTVCIGAIRRFPLKVVEMLRLPPFVIPISGLCVGYAAEDPGLKPRLPMPAVYHQEHYDAGCTEKIAEYNRTFEEYTLARSGGQKGQRWSERIVSFYRDPFYRDNTYAEVRKMLKRQGFAVQDRDE